MANMSSLSEYDTSLYDYVYEYPYSTAWTAIVPLILSIIICVTVVGNIFVVAAYFRDKNIRSNVANLLILNLAITDLLVGTFILTFNTAWLIKDYWPFGEIPCKLWLTFDYTVTMMSVVTMVLISWDRYCLVSMGMKYKAFQSRRRVSMTLVIAWTSVITFYTLMAFTWGPIRGESEFDYSEDCEMEFTSNLTATIVVNVFEFFIPITLLISLNIAVYLNIKRRSKGSVGQTPVRVSIVVPPTRNRSNIHISPRRSNYVATQESAFTTQPNETTRTHDSTRGASGNSVNDTSGECPNAVDHSRVTKTERRVFVRHRKAALVLAILVGCFLVCWLPYQVSSVMFAICGDGCVSDLTWEVTNTLLWCNSTINPFIYAATNVHFRRNFRQFLFLDHWACDVRRCKCRCRRETRNIVLHDTVNDSLNTS